VTNTSKRGFKRDLNPGTKKMTAMAKLRRNPKIKVKAEAIPESGVPTKGQCKMLSRGAEKAQPGITKFVQDQKKVQKKVRRDVFHADRQRNPPKIKANLGKKHPRAGLLSADSYV